MTGAIFSKHASFIAQHGPFFGGRGFLSCFFSACRLCIRAASASCQRLVPGRKVHFSPRAYYMRGRAAGSNAEAENQGRKGGELIVAIGTCITLYYTTAPSPRSSWFPVDWGSLSLSLCLPFPLRFDEFTSQIGNAGGLRRHKEGGT